MKKPLNQRPVVRFINTLGNQLYISLIAAGVDESQALEGVENAIANSLETCRGINTYLSKQPQTAARQAQVLEDLKHMPAHEVDRKYGYSRGYAAKLKKQQQKKARGAQ